ncbi:hypothetical protein [Riemerella columbipharyngis]|nr:hypothetical protein [Riemerella columbipharyngis]
MRRCKNYNKNEDLKRNFEEKLAQWTDKEIAVFSIVLGILVAVFSAYCFGGEVCYNNRGHRTLGHGYYCEYKLNYFVSFIGFIIVGGVSYLLLKNKSIKHDKEP